MPSFSYRAARPDGEIVEGVLEAQDQQSLARRLQAAGQMPLKIEASQERRQASSNSSGGTLFGGNAVNQRDIDFATLELATLLRAGLPLDRALDTLTRLTEKPALTELISGLHQQIRGGSALSAAMEQTPKAFDRFYLNMVRAGEATGALDLALERLNDFRQRSRELRESLVSALIYPAILLVMTIIALIVITTVVLPRFTELFADAGASLPALTVLVMAVGDFVNQHGWILILLAVLSGLGLRQWLATDRGRQRFDGWLLNLPQLGIFFRKLEAARFTRTLSTLLSHGVSLLKAIEIARETIGNRVVSQSLEGVGKRVRQGQGLARPLADAESFPALTTQLIQVGEETGRLEEMLEQLAQIYEREVQTTLARLLALLQPLMLIVMAGLIAVIIIGIIQGVLASNDLAL